MRALVLFALALCAAVMLLALAPVPAQAQDAPLTCPEMVRAALDSLTEHCTGVGRNTVCYGNVLVNSTFTEPVPEGFFSQPADLAGVVTLRTLTTAPMDEAANVWGVALMNIQANLPGSLPGQSVTMLLLGDAAVGNAVEPQEAALPADPVELIPNASAPVHMLPTEDAPVAGMTTPGAPVLADARTPDNQWVRVAVTLDPADQSFGGWVHPETFQTVDLSLLPVVSEQTRTPMQAFVFRTGIGQPNCAEAPNSVLIQGPNNTQVVMNVNGADLTVGSTVRLSSVEGAPQDIIDLLDLPDDVEEQLGSQSDSGDVCGVMQMNVLSGNVEVNEGSTILPAGNTAYAVACQPDTPEATPEPGSPESTPEPGDLPNADFASDWGAFGQMSEEEIEALLPLEELDDTILQYGITLPDPDNIQPPITVTPTPTPGFGGGIVLPTATPTAEMTPTPTPNPTIPPGTGLSAGITVDTAANNQTAPVGQPFPVPFAVTVTDPYGGPSIGVPVTFSAPASGASGTFAATGTNTQSVYTDSAGRAAASAFTSNTVAGSYSVTVSAPRDVGSFAVAPGKDGFARLALQTDLVTTFSVSNAPGAPAVITAAPGGDNLSATVAATYAAQPAVLITDAYSNPVPFVPVVFTIVPVSGAGGDFSGQPSANGVTGFDGIATAPFLTANTVAGPFQVQAVSGPLSFNLSMTNLPGAPAALTATSGGGQSATVGTAFSLFLVSRVTDSYGNPVPAVSVTFTAPVSGASAGFVGSGTNSETVATDNAGYATSSAVIANTVAGSYSVTASAGSFTDTYPLTNTPGAPASMSIIAGNGQSAVINTGFGIQMTVNVVDAYGNAVPGASVTFTAPGSGASGAFSGSATVTTNSAGNATANPFTANNTAGGYTVTASSGAASANFSLTNLNPVPALTGLSPNAITAGNGDFTVTLTGTGFVPGIAVTWTGQPNLAATYGSSTSATVTIPAAYVAAPGTFSAGVVNPGPGGGASGTQTFTVNSSTVVTSLADSGPGSLRQIITDAPAGSTITFSVSGTITLTSGVLNIGNNLTISGPGAGSLAISGNNASRIFDVYGGTLSLSGLRLTAGRASGPGGEDGGAIYVFTGAALSANGVQFDNNQSFGNSCCEKGGAIFSVGSVTITNSSFLSNFGNQMASAVASWPTATGLSITNSCLVGNTGAGNYAVSASGSPTISGNWFSGGNTSNPADSAPAGAPISGVPGC